MPKNRPFIAVAVLLLVLLSSIFNCDLPSDPDDPSNTSVNIVLRTATWRQDSESIVDTVGNAVLVGAALHLPENIDSIGMTISGDGTSLFDTVFSDFSPERNDTVWKTMTFLTHGEKTVTVIPYSSLALSEVTGSITVIKRPGPDNTAPIITVSGDTILFSAEVCSLIVHASDSDSGQSVDVSIEGAPQGAELRGDSLFVWSVPDSFTGADTVLFIATDNAILPLSDTDTVIITVSAGSENHAPEWSDDTLEVSMNDTGSYRLPLFESCSDPDEDELDWELLPGAPDGDTIIDGEYRFGATSEAIETHYVRIVAMDVDSATDTLVIELTVERIPDVGFFLRFLLLSAGTVTEQSAPVPDTVFDTVSYMDSMITITPVSFDTQCTIFVGEQSLHSGTTSDLIPLAVGTTASGIEVIAPDNDEERKTYTVLVVRKPNSTIPLCTLTVTASPASGGSVDKDKAGTSFPAGTEVTLTATPNADYRFDGWAGDTTVAKEVNSLTVTMRKNRMITAKWVRQFTLTLITSDSIKGEVSSTMGISPLKVDSGMVVPISATPGGSFKFKQWTVTSGHASIAGPTSTSTSVTMAQGNATVQGGFGCITFKKVFGQPIVTGDSYGNVCVAQWDDDSYFIAGKKWNNGILNTFAEIDKMDKNGTIVWAKTYGLTEYSNEFTSIQKISDGFLLAGSSNFAFQFWKIVPNGTEIFRLAYNNIKGIPAFAHKASDGGFIIGGENAEMFTSYIIKSDISGNIVWADSSAFCESGYHVYDGQQTNDGGFVYVGSDMPLNLFVVKRNNTGAVAWCQNIAGEFNGRTIRQTSDDGFITVSINSTECVLIKINSSGNVVWKSENSSVEKIATVRQTSDGGFVYAGSTRLIGEGGYDFCLTKTDSAGAVAWTRTYGAAETDEIASSMEIANDGGFIIVGSCGSSIDEHNLYVVKTDENGVVD